MRTITLDAQYAKRFSDDTKLPELGPARIFGKRFGPLVLPIKERRFMTVIESKGDEVPKPGTATFIETIEPETPYTRWDGIGHTKYRRAVLADELERMMTQGPEKDFEQYYEDDLRRLRESIEQHDKAITDSESLYRPDSDHAFGQPTFLQGSRVPLHEGRPVYHLLTLETGWGDAGNENYMVALDDDGWPVAVYFEASCC